jgi:hypothetical protein
MTTLDDDERKIKISDDYKRMKTVRSNGWKPRPLDSREFRGGC